MPNYTFSNSSGKLYYNSTDETACVDMKTMEKLEMKSSFDANSCYCGEQLWAPQGWQCPICKRVYSPTTPFCYYCPIETETITTTAVTVSNEPTTIDLHQSLDDLLKQVQVKAPKETYDEN